MNNKGVSIVGVVGIMLLLSMLGLTAVSLLSLSSSVGLDYMQSQQAFYIAEAGKQWYVEQLKADTDWSDNATTGNKGPISFSGGSFVIAVSNCQVDSIDFTSTATINGYENQAIQRAVSCHVAKSNPNAFNYALYVGGTINSQSSVNFIVNGQQAQNVTDLPTVDFTYYRSNADHIISGAYSFNPGTYSGIWYIDGNVTVKTNVIINGTIITTGNIDMKKQANITINPVSPYPALVADGNLDFGGSSNIIINGLVYIGADLSGNFLAQKATNITVTGTVIVAGNFNLQNSTNTTITFNSSILTNPPPGFSDVNSTAVVSGWKEVIN